MNLKKEKINRRELFQIGLASFAGFVGASVALPVDSYLQNYFLAEDIQRVKESTVYLSTFIKYDGGKKTIRGQGLVVGDYIFTVNHLVAMSDFLTKQMPEGKMIIPREGVSEETILNQSKLEVVLKDSDLDIAIFKLPKDYEKPEPVKIGDDDGLRLFDELYLVGNLFIPNKGLYGVGGALNFPGKFKPIKGKVATMRGGPGNSGSSILNRKGEVVGLASNINDSQTYIVFKPINWFMNKVPIKRISYEI